MESISISVLCTIGGFIVALITLQRKNKKDIRADTKEDVEGITTVAQEIKYVSRGVDEIKYDIRDINKNMSDMNERLIRAEESCKQAHKRIDNLEGK